MTTYHAVYWSYRASRTDRWFLPCSIPWVPGLPEVAHSMTEDPEDRGYRPTMLWGQWQLLSFSISNGDGRWPVGPPGVKGQGRAMQQHSNKQKARAPPTGSMQQPSHKAARMRRSKNRLLVGCPLPSPLGHTSPQTLCIPHPAVHTHKSIDSQPWFLGGSSLAWPSAFIAPWSSLCTSQTQRRPPPVLYRSIR